MSSTQQLAAIMFTDIVGYTALMGESEEKAIKLLDKNRKLHKGEIEKFGGRLLKEMGDGILASFDSASKAVYCAGAIQMAAKDQSINLRIGIHLGDVVFSNGDVFGDGVNIASRIEPLAESGGIAISGSVYGNIRNKEGIHPEFLKEESLKNVDEPVKIYKVTVDHIPDVPKPGPTEVRDKVKRKRSGILMILLASITVVALGFLLWNLSSKWKNASQGTALTLASIAVLPFEDLSPEGDQEYLGDGLAEEILNVLTRIDGLKVIGRTSSFAFKGKSDDLVAIGSKLGVGTILEGSVRKSDNKIRVTAQLINAQDGTHFWSETYDRELEDIFSIQDDISARIAEKFKLTVSLSREESPPTRDIEAYEMYLKGRQSAELGIIGTKLAVEYLEKAVELDPVFYHAYLELSNQYWLMGIYSLADPEVFNLKSKNAVQKAIEIDPGSYLGYLQLSFLDFSVDWDWEASRMNFAKALSLGMTPAQSNNGVFQIAIYNNPDSAIAITKQALKNDPLSIDYLLDLSRMYMYAGKYDSLLINAEKVIELNPENTSIQRHMGTAYLYTGYPEKALPIFEKLLQINIDYAPYGYIGALVRLGRENEARQTMKDIAPSLSSLKKALCYIQLSEMDSVFRYLDKAYSEQDIWMAFIKIDPYFDPIKDDPRYQALVEKMNFPKY